MANTKKQQQQIRDRIKFIRNEIKNMPDLPQVKPENNKHMAELHEYLNEQNQNIDL